MSIIMGGGEDFKNSEDKKASRKDAFVWGSLTLGAMAIVASGYYIDDCARKERAKLDKQILEGYVKSEKVQIGNGAIYFDKADGGDKLTIRMSDGTEAVISYQGDIEQIGDTIKRVGKVLKKDPRFSVSSTNAPLDSKQEPQKVR